MTRFVLGLYIALGIATGCGGDSANAPDGGPETDAMPGMAVCGNGVPEAGETCDDGNTVDGDSCPATCATTQCGDGVIAPGELCLPFARPFAPSFTVPSVVGDFDGDGHLDVAGMNGDVLRIAAGDGTGHGNLTVESTLTDVEVRDIAAADVDGSGDDDLAFVGTRTRLEGDVTVTEDGLGFLAEDGGLLFVVTDDAATQLVGGDVDGDGDEELFAGGEGGPTSMYAIEEGGGLSVSPVTGAEDAAVLTVADVDGDGTPELLAAAGGGIAMFRFQDGQMVPVHNAERGIVPAISALVAGDIDGNGLTDIVIYGAGAAAVLAQSATGFPDAAAPAAQIAPVPGALITLIDVDVDGDLDLIAAGGANSNVVALINDGGQLAGGPAGSLPLTSVVAGDFDEDGLVDLVGQHRNGPLAIVPSRAHGRLVFPRRFALAGPAFGVATGDVTGDGIADIVATTFDAPENAQPISTVAVLRGQAEGAFAPPETLAGGTCEWPFAVSLADVGGDETLDIVATCLQDGHLAVYVSAAGGWNRKPDLDLTTRIYDAATGDLNGDGHDDVVATYTDDSAVGILLGDGDELVVGATLQGIDGPNGIDLGDVDGDGDLDVVVAQDNAETVSVFVNATGRADFQPAGSYAVGIKSQAVVVADVSGDGAVDIAVTGDGDKDDSLTVLINNGDGSFQDAVIATPPLAAPFGMAIGDVDGDGTAGVMVAARSSDSLYLIEKPGAEGETSTELAVENRPFSVALADLNGDGAPDVVTSYQYAHSITVGLSAP